MKTTALFTATFSILVVGVSFNSAATPIEDPTKAYCSLKTLRGSYIYTNQGYSGGQPYASSGLMSFNGAGKIAVIYTNSITREQAPTTGTYTVDSNCSGTMTFATGSTVNNISNTYFSPTGDSMTFVRVSGDDVIGSEAKRVSRKLIVK